MRARHNRTTGGPKRALLCIQAGNDTIDIGNVIVAEAINIGLASLLVFRRPTALCERWNRHRERQGNQSKSQHVEPRKSTKSGGNTDRPTKFLTERRCDRRQGGFGFSLKLGIGAETTVANTR
jgi:hypothetical protein